ncbi:bromodomain-containing protein 9 [Exaiptasia diaphana]|uniref:Bromo domain-containing protein n=1 Tax=Exaiptasia diaphana TaxID=2652724 RepID=A0A913X0P3_EXADI|nr:bromodomain-containing protein 9 [Exaiptasia diaphana]
MSSHDKSKKKRDRIEMEGDDSLMDMERPIKKIHIKPIEPPPRPKPEPEPKPKAKKKPKADPTALQLCLENLLTIIQRKDVQGFFAFPVNDAIAPGYSRVIEKPMDFSTIRNKIDSGQYTTIEGFRDDFHLMCNNATIYNAPDTIYYKAAKRLLLIGDKMMTQVS